MKRMPEFYFICGILDHMTNECHYEFAIKHKVNDTVHVPIYEVLMRPNYEAQSLMSHFWPMDNSQNMEDSSQKAKCPNSFRN